jgi:hypothetical protein
MYSGRRIDSIVVSMLETAAMKTRLISQWAIGPPCGDLFNMSSSLLYRESMWLFFQVLDHCRIFAWPIACPFNFGAVVR